MLEFRQLNETGVELLPTLVAEGAFLFGELLAFGSQRHGRSPLAGPADGDVLPLDEPLASERTQVLAHTSLVSSVAVPQEVLFGDSAKGSDLLDRSQLALAQTIRSVAQRYGPPVIAERWAFPVAATIRVP